MELERPSEKAYLLTRTDHPATNKRLHCEYRGADNTISGGMFRIQ